jgi:hypothetical protein
MSSRIISYGNRFALNGGSGFAGKSGRNTANVRDANPMETTIDFFRDHGN